MPKVSVMFARFPGGACDHPDTTDWLVQTVLKAKADPRISDVFHWRIDDTPITMGRNRAIKKAKEAGVDYLLMIDSDMKPDLPLEGARPFWDSTLDFMLQHNGPCAVAAPYCGPPPHENIYVFRWGTVQSDHPNADMAIIQYGREEAADRVGFEQVAALPTGIFMMDMRCIEGIDPPYFYYEWSDDTESEKASTEDVTFTRDISLAGVPIYVNWDAWAGHWKRKCVTKPNVYYTDHFAEKIRKVALANKAKNQKIIMVGEGVNRGMQQQKTAGRPAISATPCGTAVAAPAN